MQSSQLLGAFLLVLTICQANAKSGWFGRTWQSSMNFNHSNNWNIGRVPCDADRVVMQDMQRSRSAVLAMPEGKTFLRELVLSSYAEILLPQDGTIQFTETKHSRSCVGRDAVFKHTQKIEWLDPQNWDKWTKATPDLERVPCATEAVRFLPGSTQAVVMPNWVRVGSIEVNGVEMDTNDWMDFVHKEGSRQFFTADGDPAYVDIYSQSCPASDWCPCGNEYLHSQVCTAPCSLPLCKQPVQPSGFCCPICGVYFLLRNTQNKLQLNEHINTFLKGKGVAWHASKVKEFVQVVLVEEEEYTGKVPDIAEDLKTSLINSGLGWTVEAFHSSGHVWYPTTFEQVVGHFLSLMVFATLTLAAIVAFYSKHWSWLSFTPLEGRPFVFARFENQSGEVVVASDRQQAPVHPQAFDNPMYGATGQEQRNVTVENPMYTELEETSRRGSVKESTDLDTSEFSVN